MSFPSPSIDDRRFKDLVRETLDRVPVHTPEWTHLGESDPGVTLVELFAFLSESVLYRANRVPEAARAKFLNLLGLKLSPSAPAKGLVAFDATREPFPVRLDANIEVRAGSIPFRTLAPLDALPLESLAMVKETATPSATEKEYYSLLYSSLGESVSADPVMYRTRILDGREPVYLRTQTVDGYLWIALLLPESSISSAAEMRSWLAGRYLSLGIVPWLEEIPKTMGTSRGQGAQDDPTPISRIDIPNATFKDTDSGRVPLPGWAACPFRGGASLHKGPDVLEIQMPGSPELLDISAWDELDPLESGVGEFPPTLLDSKLAARVAGWVRITPSTSLNFAVTWAGINTTLIEQRQVLLNEVLGQGDGSSDQTFNFKESGIIGGSVSIQVLPESDIIPWTEIDDLAAAGPEVRWTDPAAPPSTGLVSSKPVNVFLVNEVESSVTFGDGLRGKRPPTGSQIVANYSTTMGAFGNLPAGAIKTSPDNMPSIKPRNPIPTWGGVNEETIQDGSRRVSAWMRHRDRLVTAEDFEEIARSTPGVDLGRIEVLPAWHPDLTDRLPGDVPGVVSLMVLPRNDARDPSRPQPDSNMLENLCRQLDPRRLVTTEIVVCGPVYVPIRISVGITVAGGYSAPDVRDRLEARIRQYLAPLRDPSAVSAEIDTGLSYRGMEKGWPLLKEVNRLELLAEAAREVGVLRIDDFILDSDRTSGTSDSIRLVGVELPWISALSVVVGPAMPIEALLGSTVLSGGSGSSGSTAYSDTQTIIDPITGETTTQRRFPLPIIPETC